MQADRASNAEAIEIFILVMNKRKFSRLKA